MKKKSIRFAAADIIGQVLKNKKNLKDVLAHSKASSDYTAYLQELCYGTLRFYFRLNFYLKALLKKPLPSKLQHFEYVLLIGLYELTYTHTASYAIIDEIVNAAKTDITPHQSFIPGLMNAILRNYMRQKEKLDTQYSNNPVFQTAHPLWYIQALEKNWPIHKSSIINSNNQYPPLHLRVNRLKISRQDYLALLLEANISAKISPHHEWGVTLSHPLSPQQIPGFLEGLCSIQDLGAQYAAFLLKLEAGHRVLDACAAPGGKTTHLLEMQPELAEVLALDHDEKRCLKIKENLDRLQLSATVSCKDAALIDSYWDKILFDRILLDTPCSATGVVRRHPDIKILRQPSDIQNFKVQQEHLLNALWEILKPNGIFLYVTCSILPEENEDMISRFLETHPSAKIDPIFLPIGEKLTLGHQLLPGQDEGDGFYYARLRKIP